VLGIALDLYNVVRLTARPGRSIEIVSPMGEEKRGGARAMVLKAANLFFDWSRQLRRGFDLELEGDIPIARGLGSSVTIRLGVVAALNELTASKLSRQRLLEMVTQLEGHPDNAAPAVFGGFTAAGKVNHSIRCIRFPLDRRLKFIALIPHFEISTKEARKLLPHSFSKGDTVYNINRAALITAAFASGDLKQLAGLFEDRIHQPYRERLIPQLSRVIRAGEAVGAVGGWLSGSGSTIMCLALEKADQIAAAMKKELPDSEVRVLTADNEGFKLVGS
jgi:homoserine kinase